MSGERHHIHVKARVTPSRNGGWRAEALGLEPGAYRNGSDALDALDSLALALGGNDYCVVHLHVQPATNTDGGRQVSHDDTPTPVEPPTDTAGLGAPREEQRCADCRWVGWANECEPPDMEGVQEWIDEHHVSNGAAQPIPCPAFGRADDGAAQQESTPPAAG